MKRYYWLKLNQNFFDEDKIDFLMGQKNGANYVVLYQMLCLKTINNKGNLATKIDDTLVPYDADKIVRDCKFFSKDTVIVALELFKKLGLVYESSDNNILMISNFNSLVGSESDSAARVRAFRQREQVEALQCNKNVTQNVTQNVTIEKDIDIDIDIDIENMLVNKNKNKNYLDDKKRARACEIVQNLTKKYGDILDFYKQNQEYSKIFDQIFSLMAIFEVITPIKFNGKIITDTQIKTIWSQITDQQLLSIIKTIRYSEDIKNLPLYILGAFINTQSIKTTK